MIGKGSHCVKPTRFKGTNSPNGTKSIKSSVKKHVRLSDLKTVILPVWIVTTPSGSPVWVTKCLTVPTSAKVNRILRLSTKKKAVSLWYKNLTQKKAS